MYPGRVHSFHGEPESGKSLVAQAEAARVLTDGGRVLFVDFESDRGTVALRLLALGASVEAILERFHYVRPEGPPSLPHEQQAWTELLAQRFDLAVLDGVTEALSLAGIASKDNDAVTLWVRRVPRAIAHRTGAAVVVIDHVVKDSDSRGRYAIGGQAKLAALDGAAYVVDVVQPLGRGLRGVLSLRVAKDRPGAVRGFAGKPRRDRTAEAARVTVDSTGPDDRIVVTVDPPVAAAPADDDLGGSRPWRPTALMEKVSRLLEDSRDPVVGSTVTAAVRGKRTAVSAALDLLVAEQYVARVMHGRAQRHHCLRPYRQTDDPLSDLYQPRDASDLAQQPPRALDVMRPASRVNTRVRDA
nr:AAA family ATPase [Kineococcus aurantiacus]